MTGDEPQGTMGRVQTAGVVSFPPSFARTFSSKERRLGTRQTQRSVNAYKGKQEKHSDPKQSKQDATEHTLRCLVCGTD